MQINSVDLQTLHVACQRFPSNVVVFINRHRHQQRHHRTHPVFQRDVCEAGGLDWSCQTTADHCEAQLMKGGCRGAWQQRKRERRSPPTSVAAGRAGGARTSGSGGTAEARTRFKAEEEQGGGEQDDQSGKSSFSCSRLKLKLCA